MTKLGLQLTTIINSSAGYFLNESFATVKNAQGEPRRHHVFLTTPQKYSLYSKIKHEELEPENDAE